MNHNTQHNIGLLLKKRAAISANLEAFIEFETQRRFTFLELNQRCNRVANRLLEQGIKPGERIALLLKNGIEFIESYFAAAKIGAIVVPINWRLAAAEITYILDNCAAAALIFDSDFDNTVEQLPATKAAIRWRVKATSSAPSTPSVSCDDYDSLLEGASCGEPPVGAWDDDLLFIMYTSGTTGRPKGAMHSHDAMLWAQLTSLTTSDMRGDDRFLLPLPMFHVGCLVPVSQLVHRGATGVILRDIDMLRMFEAISAEQISLFMAVPALLQFMLLTPERERYDLSSLRWIATGAAPVPVSLLDAWDQLGVAIYQAYGLTESCGPGTLLCPQDARAKIGSAGHPQMHTEIRVIDAEGEVIPPGSERVGELLISGRHIMKGYWNNPAASREAIRDGWLYTGDLVRQDIDGCITICDRKKDLIISGGENIYPAEIENALMASPEVQEVAVIGIASSKWGETPLAIVVPAPGHRPDPVSLMAFCKQQLASYKVPQLYEFVDSLPRNPSGKLVKPELRRQFPGPAPF